VRRLPANGTSMNSAAEVPAISGELAAPPLAPIGNVLVNGAVQAPPPPAPQSNKDVQKAHLISSVPPEYPPLAKSNHIEGDVTVDAFVDSTGRVTDVNVISGPPLLGWAAVDAVRQWRYEPARLRGQPAASHIIVTIKFHFDQSAH
jgi:protein TonB